MAGLRSILTTASEYYRVRSDTRDSFAAPSRVERGAHGGYWFATSYDAAVTIARETKVFTSWKDLPSGSGPRSGGQLLHYAAMWQGFAEMDDGLHQALAFMQETELRGQSPKHRCRPDHIQ
jgi:hypothetical protein